jgi:hypothetical protein
VLKSGNFVSFSQVLTLRRIRKQQRKKQLFYVFAFKSNISFEKRKFVLQEFNLVSISKAANQILMVSEDMEIFVTAKKTISVSGS